MKKVLKARKVKKVAKLWEQTEESEKDRKAVLKQAIANLVDQAVKGGIEAQFQLGERYRTGRDVEQNSEEAERWYRMSAGQGHVEAKKILKRLLTR